MSLFPNNNENPCVFHVFTLLLFLSLRHQSSPSYSPYILLSKLSRNVYLRNKMSGKTTGKGSLTALFLQKQEMSKYVIKSPTPLSPRSCSPETYLTWSYNFGLIAQIDVKQ